jgi:hypothetical protein
MRSLRTIAYAAFLALSMFTIQPTLAAAEDVRGVFTLAHEVHWQKYVLKAGSYSFSFKSNGLPIVLTLRGLNGTGTDAMLLVSDVETSKSDAAPELLLVSRDGSSFVSSLSLPAYEMLLRFAVPAESARTVAMK